MVGRVKVITVHRRRRRARRGRRRQKGRSLAAVTTTLGRALAGPAVNLGKALARLSLGGENSAPRRRRRPRCRKQH